jgi:hypothetical protein
MVNTGQGQSTGEDPEIDGQLTRTADSLIEELLFVFRVDCRRPGSCDGDQVGLRIVRNGLGTRPLRNSIQGRYSMRDTMLAPALPEFGIVRYEAAFCQA